MSKITIVGRGLDPSKHLSLEALEAIKKADKILGIESEKDFWIELQSNLKIKEIEDISYLYVNNAKDTENYQSFVDLIIKLSIEFKSIVLLVAGHPRVGVSFISMLQEAGPTIDVHIIEGLSSLDIMLNYLAIDPLEAGTTMVDANRLLLFKYRIEPAQCYFIYHVCSVGNSRTNYQNSSDGNQISRLKNYLLKFYTKDKIVYLCRMSNGKGQQSEKIPITIATLDENLSLIDFSTTLFIPAEDPSCLDFEYLNLLREV